MAEVVQGTGDTPRYNPTDREQKALRQVNQCLDEARRWHTSFARKVEKRYDAYRGLLPDQATSGWRSNQHPPYLINIVEGMLSSMEESVPTFKVKPRAVPGMSLQELIDAKDNAALNEYLLQDQMRIDRFEEKQSPFMLQDLIAGFSPAKVYWLKEECNYRYLDQKPEMIYDELGGSIDIAMKLDEYEKPLVTRDSPTFEVRDVRDFLFPESATSIEKAPWIIDRVFVSYQTLKRMEQLGVYYNCKYVKETRIDSSPAGPDIVKDREQRLRNIDRTRGLVELIELWTPHGDVIAVANRSVVVRQEVSPLSHGEKPFISASAIPDIFSPIGISVIEGLASMQEMLWTMMNLRLDTTRMAANLITLIRGDVDNLDDYEWAPGAQWVVTDPGQVQPLKIDPAIATITLQAEALLKGDIQSVMGGLPYQAGSQSQTVDQQTATGVSIITNIAQQVLARRKQNFMRAFSRVGYHFLRLNQQFIREDRLVEILGEGGATHYMEVNPLGLQGIFDVNVEMSADSMMRQERRAESGQLLTQAVQFGPVSAQMGAKLNIKRFWEKHLDAFDVPDKETYFDAAAPAQIPAPTAAQPAAPGTPPGQDALLTDMAPPNPDPGITNASLAAGPTSPSSPVTMSPAAPAQRANAMVGSGRSV